MWAEADADVFKSVDVLDDTKGLGSDRVKLIRTGNGFKGNGTDKSDNMVYMFQVDIG